MAGRRRRCRRWRRWASRTSGSRRSTANGCSRASPPLTWRSCCTSRRRACCAPGARLDDGRVLEADVVVWACGAWLGRLFAEHVAIRSARQELFFFDGGPAWRAPGVPAYVDFDRAIYGTRDIDGLGVKAAPDFDGPPLEPDAELPPVTPESEAIARRFLATRFPALAGAPLAGAKTCRYELSPDGHFIAAPLPDDPSVWLLGGGSGHGFKHGPVLAERVAAALAGGEPLPPEYALADRTPVGSFRTAGAAVNRTG